MKSVVFDIGNVLIDWDPKRLFRDVFSSDAEIEKFFAEIDFHDWNLALDRGGSWADAVTELSDRHPRHAGLIDRFNRNWHSAVSGPIGGSVEILDALGRGGVPVYAITNFSVEKWAETRARFPFLASSFRDVVVSAHEGLVKPNPAIFRRFLDRNGLTAAACVFIDDSPANVRSAASLGFDAILFETPVALAAQLAARGLPVGGGVRSRQPPSG